MSYSLIKNFIDNVFSTDTTNEVIVINILMALSDHLAQFLLFLIKRTKPESKANNYWCKLNDFILKYSAGPPKHRLAHSTQTQRRKCC